MNLPVVESTLTSIGSSESLSVVQPFSLLKLARPALLILGKIWSFMSLKGPAPCSLPSITLSTTVISLISALLERSVTCFTVKSGASISPDVVSSV